MDLKHLYPISTIQILYEFMIKSKYFISKGCCFGVLCHHHVHVNSSLNTMLYLGQTSKSFKRDQFQLLIPLCELKYLWEVFMPNFKNIKVPNTKMFGRHHKCFVDIFKLFQKKEKYDIFLGKHDKQKCVPHQTLNAYFQGKINNNGKNLKGKYKALNVLSFPNF